MSSARSGGPRHEGGRLRVPTTIVCADWSGSAGGRAICIAKTAGPVISLISPPAGEWTVERVVETARMARQPGDSLVVGFDAPIGLPRSHWDRLIDGIDPALRPPHFAEWLARNDFEEAFFEPCANADAWSVARPFFRIESGAGGRTRYEAVIARAGVDPLRRVDASTGGKPVFVLSGIPGVAGGSACDLWRGLQPLRRAGEVAIWPFDGPLGELTAGKAPAVAEIYPRLAYPIALDGETAARNSRDARRPASRIVAPHSSWGSNWAAPVVCSRPLGRG